jgi:WD40 repeat protein
MCRARSPASGASGRLCLLLAALGTSTAPACISEAEPAPSADAGTDAGFPDPPAPLPAAFQACGGIGAGGLAHSALSPDGRDLAVATTSGQLLLLDPLTGERRRTIWALEGALSTVRFSRRADVLLAANATKVIAWSHPGGSPILTLDQPHPARVDRLDLSPEGTLLATGAIHAGAATALVVHLWSFPGGVRRASLTLTSVSGGHASPVLFSPDGNEIMVGSRSFSVAQLLLAGATEDGASTQAGAQGAYSPDYRYLAVGGRVFDRASGREVPSGSLGQAEAFSPDGGRYLVGSALYHVDPFKFVRLPTIVDEQPVSHVQFTPDGQHVIQDLGGRSQSPDRGPRIRVRRMPDLTIERTFSLGPFGRARPVFSADGTRLVRRIEDPGSQEATYWISDTETGRTVASVRRKPGRPEDRTASLLGLSADGALVVTEREVLDAASGTVQATFPTIELLSPSGRLLVWRDIQGQHVAVELPGLSRQVGRILLAEEPLAISPDDRHVLTVAPPTAAGALPDRRSASLVELATGARAPVSGWSGDLASARFTWDGRHLVTWSAGRDQEVVRLEDGKVVAAFPATTRFDVSPDGRHVVVGSRRGEGGLVRVLRLDDLAPVLTLAGHGSDDTPDDDAVDEVSWSRTNLIASAGADGAVRIWCVPP